MESDNNILQQIRHLRLMDDVLMVKCFENDKECTELLLQPILKIPTLRVQGVTALWHGPSVGLDVSATGSQGREYKVKVFQSNTADRDNQVGFGLYSAEWAAIRAGKYCQEAAYHVVYIVEHGTHRQAVYRSGIMLDEAGEDSWCGLIINTFYVNGDRKNRSPLGRLMYDFSCTDPSCMNYPQLADRVRYFKENKQGIQDLCEMLEEKWKRTRNYEAPKDN